MIENSSIGYFGTWFPKGASDNVVAIQITASFDVLRVGMDYSKGAEGQGKTTQLEITVTKLE